MSLLTAPETRFKLVQFHLNIPAITLLQGITRVKTSSDVVGAVLKELKLQCGQPASEFRLAVAVDGVNALWGKSTIKKEDKSAVRRCTHFCTRLCGRLY